MDASKPSLDMSAEELSELLSRDLPISLEVGEPWREGYAHDVFEVWWHLDHGQKPFNETPFVARIALVTPEGREKGYKSGIVRIDNAFPGFNIGRIFVRNAIDVFNRNGDMFIEGNTQDMGARIWQNLGLVAQAEANDLNGDEYDIFSDWSPDNVYMSHAEQCRYITNKLNELVEFGVIDQARAETLIAMLDPDDPYSIWDFVEHKSQVTLKHYGHEYEDDLVSHVMHGMRVRLGLDFRNNMQMARLAEKVGRYEIDPVLFQQRLEEYIHKIRADYAAEEFYDCLYS